jgi:RHS repeat-associated protein
VNDRDKFATYRRDSTTGLDYANHRYYATQIARFTTTDKGIASPASPQSWNRYAYASNDPVNFYDPSGLQPLPRMLSQGMCAGKGIWDWGDACGPGSGGGGLLPLNATIFCPDPSPEGGGGCPNVPNNIDPGINTGGGAPRPTAVQRFAALSSDCQKGLSTALSVASGTSDEVAAQLRLDALGRASAAAITLSASGTGWAMIAAIGIRETGFRNIDQPDGQGAGVFQIDLGQHPEVTAAQAHDLAWAANWAANLLSVNALVLAAKFPDFTQGQLLQATAASYNFGTGNVSGNPATIDVGTTNDNYGSNILDLMRCFK